MEGVVIDMAKEFEIGKFLSEEGDEQGETITAQSLIKRDNLDLEMVYSIIDAQGMDPEKLFTSNVEFIKSELKRGTKKTSRSGRDTDLTLLPYKNILKIRNPDERTDLYLLIGKDGVDFAHFSEEEMYSWQSFVDSLEEVNVPLIVGKTKKKKKTPQMNTIRKEDEQKKGKRTTRAPFVKRIQKILGDYLVENADDLCRLLYADPKELNGDVVDISQNTMVLEEILDEKLLSSIRQSGWEPSIMSVFGFMSQAIKTRQRRISRELKEYLQGGYGEFLDGFDFSKTNTYEDAPGVIKWLDQKKDDDGKDMAFYMRALKLRLQNKKVRDSKNILGAWVDTAIMYEFTRRYDFAMRELPKKSTTENYSIRMAEHYLENPKEYHRGFAQKILVGLWVMDRITDSTSLTDLRYQGSTINYLLCNFKDIDRIIHSTYNRMKEGELQPDSIKKHRTQVYEPLREGRFELTASNLDVLKRSIDVQLLPAERKFLYRMKGEKKEISDTYKSGILGLYLNIKGQDLATSSS
jgi:hypothetical protein